MINQCMALGACDPTLPQPQPPNFPSWTPPPLPLLDPPPHLMVSLEGRGGSASKLRGRPPPQWFFLSKTPLCGPMLMCSFLFGMCACVPSTAQCVPLY